ncbi:UNKNOWN [Stylonychia lemnae]|uniref:Uncharacterized protein n=1 Tax=Stylonychia lemnae TaxID=5949 RepID=A0A078AW35_STYLE|nr:UNKNOWN [Stylonychia lemnae]|eukprot:CDW86296.1 UNKNOWN [Stylonychia lemnae]
MAKAFQLYVANSNSQDYYIEHENYYNSNDYKLFILNLAYQHRIRIPTLAYGHDYHVVSSPSYAQQTGNLINNKIVQNSQNIQPSKSILRSKLLYPQQLFIEREDHLKRDKKISPVYIHVNAVPFTYSIAQKIDGPNYYFKTSRNSKYQP